MSVNTKTVSGRRNISYKNFDDLLADAESLAGQEVTTVGNWSFAQIIDHVAIALDGSIDGVDMRAPWLMRVVAKLFLKKKFLNQTLTPGYQLPESAKAQFVPSESVSLEDALTHFRHAIGRCKSETQRAPNVLLGHLTREESDRFHLRHAEMHMSFVKPLS